MTRPNPIRAWYADRLLFLEIVLAAAIVLMYSQSWPVFASIVIALLLLARVPALRVMLVFGTAALWGTIGLLIGSALGGTLTTLAIAVLFFCLRALFHF